HASGEFIVKWDDDDWYRRDFAATMLAALRPAPEPDQVAAACGCYRVFVAGERFFRFSGRTNGGGGTLTFAKSLWRRVPFRDVQGDEDAWFRTDIGRPLVLVDEPQIYVVIRHGGNTWVRNRNGQTTDRVFLGRPPVSENLRCLFSPKEAEFYLSLPAVPALLSRAARRTAAPRAPSR
ncbi:MAG: hypothetical protein IT162_06960, partial [Bryobacterales bacterium]|nr:hypothetical protein [Bryobacterales bacterium]